MAFLVQSLVNVCFLLSVISSLQWGPNPRDGETLYVCEGQDVTIPWTFNLTSGEDITSIEWLFRGASQEMVAIFTRGAFIPLPAFSGRVQQVANGGLTLHHVTTGDAGNYTIEVNGDANSVTLFESRTIILEVVDGLQTTDGQIHVTQQPDAVLDTASQEWSIVLTCGQFTYAGSPAFPVEWVTPKGEILPSTTYTNGYFNLHLASPVKAGLYVCRLPQRHLTSACLHGNLSETDQDSVKVDGVEVSMMLMKAELRALRQDKEQLTRDLLQLRDNVTHRVDNLEVTQRADNASLNRLIQEVVTPKIAFNARSTASQTLNPPTHIKLNDVLYNQGDAFSSSTGDFTAPVAGVYVFYFHTESYSSSYWSSFTMKTNNREICRADIFPQNDHGSCQAVVHLTAGDKVWVEPMRSNMHYHSHATSFTGFLLSDD